MTKGINATMFGTIGAVFTFLFGGNTIAVITALLFMAFDYLLGTICAIKGTSKHGDARGLDSSVAYMGIIKKGGLMLFIVIANRLDILIAPVITGGKFKIAAPMVIYAIIANELISICENCTRLDIWIPAPIKKYLSILNRISGEKAQTEKTLIDAPPKEKLLNIRKMLIDKKYNYIIDLKNITDQLSDITDQIMQNEPQNAQTEKKALEEVKTDLMRLDPDGCVEVMHDYINGWIAKLNDEKIEAK